MSGFEVFLITASATSSIAFISSIFTYSSISYETSVTAEELKKIEEKVEKEQKKVFQKFSKIDKYKKKHNPAVDNPRKEFLDRVMLLDDNYRKSRQEEDPKYTPIQGDWASRRKFLDRILKSNDYRSIDEEKSSDIETKEEEEEEYNISPFRRENTKIKEEEDLEPELEEYDDEYEEKKDTRTTAHDDTEHVTTQPSVATQSSLLTLENTTTDINDNQEKPSKISG